MSEAFDTAKVALGATRVGAGSFAAASLAASVAPGARPLGTPPLFVSSEGTA